MGQLNIPQDIPKTVQIACGYNHSLALTEEGKVIAWDCIKYFK